MRIDASLLPVFGAAFAAALSHHGNNTSSSNFTIAIVRAPPANMPYPPGVNTEFYGRKYDINATVELALGYIREAALKGADLVAFPELWFPGYGVLPDSQDNYFADFRTLTAITLDPPKAQARL